MDSRVIPLTLPRRITLDLMSLAKGIPTVPVQRRMNLKALAQARVEAGRPGWPALFLKAYGAVAERMPELRRAYVTLPWPHLVEYPTSVASIAVERQYAGEHAVFFARIGNPAQQTLAGIHSIIRDLAHKPLHEIKPFRKMLKMARLPKPVRRGMMWLGLNLARTRPWQFGTFGLTVYSSLGAESLHPISPLTTTLTYGVIGKNGRVNVRLIYDHRVIDGSTVARALCELEEELNGAILAEVQGMAKKGTLRLAA
jgi:hypothetical protein